MRSIDPTEAEQGLLAAMLLDPMTIATIETTVFRDDFGRDDDGRSSRGDFFDLLCEINRAGHSVRDVRFVLNQLRASGLLDRLGGPRVFNEVYNVDRTPENAKTYAQWVRDHSVKRQLRKLASSFSNRVLRGVDSASSLAQWARTELDAIESRASDASHLSTIGEACSGLVAEIQHSKATGTNSLIETGIDFLDETYGGLQAGRLYVIAARPGGGKSCLSQQLGENIADRNHAALFVSLEMSTAELASRYLARRTGINSKYISSHAVDDQDEQMLVDATARAQCVPFFISVPLGRKATVDAICADARVQKATNNISVLLVDYLQITESDQSRKNEEEYERVTKATRAFKQLSRELEIPVVLLSQLNRDSDKVGADKKGVPAKPRRPRLSDLRSSGSIEQDADCVMFLHDEGRGLVSLIVAKMRGGERDETLLRFDGPTCSFSPAPITDHENHHDEFTEWQKEWHEEFRTARAGIEGNNSEHTSHIHLPPHGR